MPVTQFTVNSSHLQSTVGNPHQRVLFRGLAENGEQPLPIRAAPQV